MRSQPGPCLAPGNSPAARRYVRRRKPPPIILWCIGIITCLLFIGAAAMLTVGYLNPFGTVGLAILGVGAVVYFGAILFLVLSCLWVERKYPGMQPLSFKIYSRKPNRMPPQTFTNPNISGQMPADTTPSYRTHNEIPIQIPAFSDVGEKTDKIPCAPTDNSQDTKDNNIQGFAQDQDKLFKVPDVLQEGNHNGGVREDDSSDIRFQALPNKDNISTNKDTKGDSSTAGIEEKSNSPSEYNKDSKAAAEHGVDQNTTSSPKRETKVKLKTHHIEVPFEDYPSSDSSTSLSKKNDKSQDIQKPILKDNSQHGNSTTENDNASKSTSAPKTSGMVNQKVVSSSVNNLSHTIDAHQKAKAVAHSDKDIRQESSNFSSAEPTVHERKQIPEKHQHGQDRSQMVRKLISTNSASPGAVSKAREHETIASKRANPVQKDSSPKASPVRDRKLLNVYKNNATNPSHSQESVQEKPHASSLLNFGKNILPNNNNLRNEQQSMTTSPKHHKQNPGSPGGSPTRAQKMQSPDRARKIRKDNAVQNSPPIIRKADSSPSPPRHHKKRPDNIPKAQRTQVQSITIQTVSSSGEKEEIQKKKIIHSLPSSQSSDLQSSSSSSPPPRHRQRSPNKSPRLPRNGDHTSRTTAFHSSPRNEELSNRQTHHSSPSSQSSDVPSSPSSSPQRTRQKSPDLSTKIQRPKHIPVTSGVLSSSNNKDEPRKRSQTSSQPSDVISSPTSSQLSSKK